MMVLTIAQRGVGLIRTALFCRLLPEHELGQWSLVFSFVMLGVPLTLMGITGSFGRYVEHYLQRGLAKQFFLRTGAVVIGLTVIALVGVWIARDWVAWCLFGSVDHAHLLLPACVTLVSVLVYSYFSEVVIALRRIKVGSTMELISSWAFAAISLCLLLTTQLGSYGVILGYAAGNLIGAAYGMAVLTGIWQQLPIRQAELTHTDLWQKLAPFAIGLWLVNIITNLFDMADRYMIVHFSKVDAIVAQGMVGQYFSSMAMPLLMVGVCCTLGHLIMPYLSKDWESRRFQAVSDRVNLSLKLIGLMLSMGSVCIVLLSPLLFGAVFGGKYDAGLAILPWTITFCFWNGISTIVYNYLYCAERTRLMCLSLVCGLATNIGLNALLLPIVGLLGAALATAAGCALNLAIVLVFSVRLGLRLDLRVLWVLAFPLLLGLGVWTATTALVGLLLLTSATNWFLTKAEHEEIEQTVGPIFAKLVPQRFLRQSAAPTA